MSRLATCRMVRVLVIPLLATAWTLGAAMTACTQIEVQAQVLAATGRLTLADFLTKGSCAELKAAAARVNLGAVPRGGSLRVFDGGEVRRLLAALTREEFPLSQSAVVDVPERIIVEPAGGMKACGEIARFLRDADSVAGVQRASGRWQELNCAAARHIPEDATLKLTKRTWHANHRRWEFTMRCARPSDCVPFLVWAKGEDAPSLPPDAVPKSAEIAVPLVVKAGQTALLTWTEGGIRIIAPVTCLDGGGVGQSVRVRFKNGPGILPAEVMNDGTLRVIL